MEITIREMDEQTLPNVNQCDSTFTVNSHLVLSAENGKISYTVAPVSPREKSYPPEPKDYRSYLNDPGKVIFFAYADGELAGQIRMLKWWNAFACIDDLAVEPRFRRHGVGRALIQRAVEWARANGFPGVVLETQNINVSACRLYQSCGFELGGFDRNVYKALTPSTDEIALYWYLIFPPS
ncbi:MAG TPA: GNAT family N-acetyltransferase [Anaerolineales bacterium]|nr:GNAT family N-acetyltransferase [Anaerolineales bacterium]